MPSAISKHWSGEITQKWPCLMEGGERLAGGSDDVAGEGEEASEGEMQQWVRWCGEEEQVVEGGEDAGGDDFAPHVTKRQRLECAECNNMVVVVVRQQRVEKSSGGGGSSNRLDSNCADEETHGGEHALCGRGGRGGQLLDHVNRLSRRNHPQILLDNTHVVAVLLRCRQHLPSQHRQRLVEPTG